MLLSQPLVLFLLPFCAEAFLPQKQHRPAALARTITTTTTTSTELYMDPASTANFVGLVLGGFGLALLANPELNKTPPPEPKDPVAKESVTEKAIAAPAPESKPFKFEAPKPAPAPAPVPGSAWPAQKSVEAVEPAPAPAPAPVVPAPVVAKIQIDDEVGSSSKRMTTLVKNVANTVDKQRAAEKLAEERRSAAKDEQKEIEEEKAKEAEKEEKSVPAAETKGRKRRFLAKMVRKAVQPWKKWDDV